MDIRVLSLSAAALLAGARGVAQSPPSPRQDHEAVHQEMEALFQQVELRQRRIDRILFDAGAGKRLQGPLEDSGIAKLLERARDASQDVKRDIDRILELAASHTHAGRT